MEVDIINEEYGPVINNVWKPIETAPRNQEIFTVGWPVDGPMYDVAFLHDDTIPSYWQQYWMEPPPPPRGE